MAFAVSNFVGELDGTTAYEINKKIDFKKTSLEERKEVIDNILKGTNFFNEYFDGYYKSYINAGEALSTENNVCKSLERMASYILNSKEVKEEEDAAKTQYVFYTDNKYLEKKMNRERSIEAIANTNNEVHNDTVMHFLKRAEGNSKKPKDQSITKKDLLRTDFLGDVLRGYQPFLDFLTEELKKKDSKYNRYLLTKSKGAVVDDMLYSKDHLLGVFGYDAVCLESTDYNLDVFDFTNKDHLKGKTFYSSKGTPIVAKGLIYFKPDFDPNDDMSFILMDLQHTIDQANLTEQEKDLLDGLRNGLTQEEIGIQLDISQKQVSRVTDRIVRKIIKVGNKYDGKKEEK